MSSRKQEPYHFWVCYELDNLERISRHTHRMIPKLQKYLNRSRGYSPNNKGDRK